MIGRVGWLLAIAATVSPPVDPFLDASMSRHMLLQMSLLAALGIVAARTWPAPRLDAAEALAALVFATGTLVFWMLPRSLDTAVAISWVDQLMHANMLAAGWVLATALPRLEFHTKTAFGIYALAMILAAGAVYAATAVPVCSTYTVQQQNAAGAWLLWTGSVLFLLLLLRGAWSLSHRAATSAAC